jgi:hypothetical protein
MGSSPFKVIEGGAAAKPKRPRKTKESVLWECRFCEVDIGVRTRQLIKVRTHARQDGKLKITGGDDIWVCAFCMTRGKMTPVTA